MSAILTKSQPSPQPTITHAALSELRNLVQARYTARNVVMPDALAAMMPCVEDALASGDEAYIAVQYGYFETIVKAWVLDVDVWQLMAEDHEEEKAI